MLPPRSATLPAGPPSTIRQKYPPRPLPPRPGDPGPPCTIRQKYPPRPLPPRPGDPGPPSTIRQKYPPRPLPPRPGDPGPPSTIRHKYPPRPLPPRPGDPGPPSTIRQKYPPRPLPPRPGDPGANPLRGPLRPTVPPPDPPTARTLRQPVRSAHPPPTTKRKPDPTHFVPYEEPATVRRPRNDLAPKTPQMKFKPPGASTPRRTITVHPDATAVSKLEKFSLPVRPDEFFSSNRVMSLDMTNFYRFTRSKDITLVIFYNRNDPESKVHEMTISQAACSTKRTNHAYAAVDCAAQSKLCAGNKVTETPMVRLYSRTNCLGQLGTLRAVTSDTLRQYVELAPSMDSTRMLSCPLIKEQQLE